ncbi:hypothetical protein EVAR_88999_1 [Eumeta japonica]|uniref:CCHC-type domain-containing protein n=1 Tax=Eumeta variegata TaxID=151549 RepID=A0A4C1X809_EUMVA|nr:hypothetical protein EVAR_88999_1 [Eumeta japonica]
MLRDRFILGLHDVKERERLFTEDAGKVTFVAAMELVQAVQCARAAARRAAAGDSGSASSVGGVFALKTATGGQGAPLESASSGGRRRAVDVRGAPLSTSSVRCIVCGNANHNAKECCDSSRSQQSNGV